MRNNKETKMVAGTVVLPNGRKYNVSTIKVNVHGNYRGERFLNIPTGSISSIFRRVLKAEGIKASDFTIRTSNFSGGTSLDVTEKVPTGAAAAVKDITDQFKGGHFDGMTDMYSYSSDRAKFYSEDGTIALDVSLRFTFFQASM